MSDTSVTIAGRYRLEAPISAGAVGQVWRAADLALDRPVAVKLLRAEYAEHPEILARFRAEAQHAGGLSHPGIAKVFDYGDGDWPGSPYLVMELVDGPSLARLLARGPLDPVRTMDVIAQAAAGLAAAHAAGLVHRDIKAANLLLGPGGQVKITDFGIAHAAGSAPLTQTGTLVGTPAYLAPERAAGAPATPASDLYSLGVVAYECLAGAVPFSGSPLEIAAAHRYQPLPPLPAGVPPGVAALIAGLTAKDPAARPASAAAVAGLAGRLRDTLASHSLASHPLARRPLARRPLARRPLARGPLARDTVPPGGPGPTPPAVTAVDEQPATLVTIPPAVLPGGMAAGRLGGIAAARPRVRGRDWGSRPWPARDVALALAAVALGAGLAGWLLATAFSGAPGAAPVASGAPAPRTVTVDDAPLVGQPVSAVRQQLSRLGLRSRVAWVPSHQLARGTVVSVQPTGQLPAGTTVLVTATLRPRRGHNGGNGNGDGGSGDG